jgi:hypothetical protein
VARHGNQRQRRPIGQQHQAHHEDLQPRRAGEHQQDGEQVGQADALQHAHDPERAEVQGRVVDGPLQHRGRGVEDEAQGEQHRHPADQPLVEGASVLGRGLAVARQGEGDRGADDEEEGGEDLIGRREAVPFGVAQGGVDVAPASRVVDQDHAGDGETPEAVQGGEAHDSDSAAIGYLISAKMPAAASASRLRQ